MSKNSQNILVVIILTVFFGAVTFLLPFLLSIGTFVVIFGGIAYFEATESGDRPDFVGRYVLDATDLPACRSGWSETSTGWKCSDMHARPLNVPGQSAACTVEVHDETAGSATCEVTHGWGLSKPEVEKLLKRHSRNCEESETGWTCDNHTVTLTGVEEEAESYQVSFELLGSPPRLNAK